MIIISIKKLFFLVAYRVAIVRIFPDQKQKGTFTNCLLVDNEPNVQLTYFRTISCAVMISTSPEIQYIYCSYGFFFPKVRSSFREWWLQKWTWK